MQNLISSVLFFVVVIGTAVSKPLWSTLVGNNYVYSTPEINARPQYLAAYPDTHSPYYIYNVHTNAGGIPSTIYASDKPEISHVPPYSFYYGTPIYDFRIPLNPVYPVLRPSHPIPGPIGPIFPPVSTEEPFDEENYDGIETLDTKIDPDTETKKPENSEQNEDSITVEAI